MIQRFRYKFIAISTAALLFVILTIVGSICTLTYYQSHQEIERVLTILVNNDGQIPEKGSGLLTIVNLNFHVRAFINIVILLYWLIIKIK